MNFNFIKVFRAAAIKVNSLSGDLPGYDVDLKVVHFTKDNQNTSYLMFVQAIKFQKKLLLHIHHNLQSLFMASTHNRFDLRYKTMWERNPKEEIYNQFQYLL